MKVYIDDDTATSKLAWHSRFAVDSGAVSAGHFESAVVCAFLRRLWCSCVSDDFGLQRSLGERRGLLAVALFVVFFLLAFFVSTILFPSGLLFSLVDLCPFLRSLWHYGFRK